MHDLVIRNGTIVDGSGLASYRADLGIDGGRIVEIGRVPGRARRELDASGHVVTPGFIDGHTHMDAQIFWDPLGSCSCWHGVTTAVIGNCGFTLAPARADARSLVVRNLERAEDISADAMREGIEWTWEDFPGYLDAVERAPKGINYAANVGHSALRTWAMGGRVFEEEATEDDLRLMEHQLETALRAGAIGFTTSRNDEHETSDLRPVASRIASWREVQGLVGVLGRLGSGIFEIGQESKYNSEDPALRKDFMGRLGALAVESGVPVTFGVLPLGPSGTEQLELIDATAAAGGRMFGQTHSRGVTLVYSFQSRLPFDRLREWQEVRALPLDAQKRAFRDPRARERLVHAVYHGEYERSSGPAAKGGTHFDRMKIFNDATGPNQIVADVAKDRGIDPVELMIDLALETDFGQLFLQEHALARGNPAELFAFMTHPRTVMTFSDSGAHVTVIMDASIHTYLLAHWVRDEQALTLEQAVRMITLEPALAWGFSDRGLLREGMVADLNVFDPERIAPELPVVSADLPGGATRLVQKATGIRATVVSGAITLEDGISTGTLPGKLLRASVPASS